MKPKHEIKFENNWQQKTLENLEKNFWPSPDPAEGSSLITTCHALRKKQLKDFTTEDLRIMIGQEIGLKYLIPLAIETLTNDLFAEGDYFPGDLLKNVLTVNPKFWNIHREYWNKVFNIIDSRREDIVKKKILTATFDNAKP